MIKNKAGLTALDGCKDPVLREELQGILGIVSYEYKGRKTRREKEMLEEPNTSDEEYSEDEISDNDSEWDEWDWEWDEVWHYTDESEEDEEPKEKSPYVHSCKPRTVSQVRVETSTPGPFHP